MSSSFLSTLRHLCLAIWNKLTEPAATVKGHDLREESRLLTSILLMVMVVLGGAWLFIPIVNQSDYYPALITNTIGLLILLAIFSHRGYTKLTVRTGVLVGTLTIFATAVTQRELGMVSLNYLVVICLLAVLFLSVLDVLFVTFLHLAGIGMLYLLAPTTFLVAGIEPLRMYVILNLTALLLVRYRQRIYLEQTERYEQLIENIHDGVFFFNPDWQITSVNASLVKKLGWQSAYLMGRPVMELIPPECHTSYGQMVRAVIAHEDMSPVEIQLIKHDGTRLWVEIVHTMMHSGESVIGIMAIARDIDERKKAQEALYISEARYRIISDIISDYAYAYRVNLDGTIEREWATESFTRIAAHYAASKQPDWMHVYHPEDAKRAKADIARVIAGEQVDGEYRVMTDDNQVRWLHIIRRPEWDEAHTRVVRFYSAAQDITKTQIATEALQASEDRYRRISEMMSDYAFAYRVTPEGEFFHEWTTDSYTRLTGYMSGELKSSFSLFHPDDIERSRADVSRTVRGETTRAEYRIITRNGDQRWIYMVRTPQWDDKERSVIRYYGVATDITERKLAEQALLASQQRLSLLVEQSPLAFIEWDENSGVTSWNPAAEKIFGYTSEEMIGRRAVGALVPHNQQEKLNQQLTAISQGEISFFHHINENITKNGSRILCEWYNMRLTDELGNFVRVATIAQDISERHRSEEQKLRLTLERERLSLISRFVLAVSHDFRTALANIETNRYLLQRMIQSGNTEKAGERMSVIQQAVRHITEQIDSLQTLSSSVDVSDNFCDLNTIVDELMHDYLIIAQQKHIRLTAKLDTTMPFVFADDMEVKLAVRHILTNALAYTPEGGEVCISSHHIDNCAMIKVVDTGQGISPEHLPYIFDLFYRADESRALNKGGVGLGLSISRMIAEAHDGELMVESVVGTGSTFTFKLPVAPQNAQSFDSSLLQA